MSGLFRSESRKDWTTHDGAALTLADLQLGCLQRIADAVELTAKRHQELIAANERLQGSVDYWRKEADRLGRRIVSLKGQVTKAKRKATGASQ